MRKLYYTFIICLLATSCNKDESSKSSLVETVKKDLNKSEIILRDNLKQTAEIFANLVHDERIINELKAISAEKRTTNSLSFQDLLAEPTKGVNDSFKTLRERFLQVGASKGSANGDSDLARYLVANKCYLYCPYPADFYPNGITNYTVAPHPIDNENEGVGYIITSSGTMTQIIVNEKYTDENVVLLIMPNGTDESKDLGPDGGKGNPGSKGTIYEVNIGFIRCADYCGGLFAGDPQLRICRGIPSFSTETEVVTGIFPTIIPVDYPRSYAKAAINNWTAHSNGGWYPVNIPWDTNWKPEKDKQGILVYEYDQTATVSVTLGVGYKKDPYSVTESATATTTYSGDFLDINEWDRDWFYLTNTNPGPTDEVYKGYVVRKTSTFLKFTTPTRTL